MTKLSTISINRDSLKISPIIKIGVVKIMPRGFILITLLIFLSMMTLVVMATLDLSWIRMKLATAQEQQALMFNAAENGLKEGEAHLVATVTMPIAIQQNYFAAHNIVNLNPLSVSNQCLSGNTTLQVCYRIVPITIVKCEQVANDQPNTVIFFRVLAEVTDSKIPGPSVTLQSNYAMLNSAAGGCQILNKLTHHTQFIYAGRQSWCELKKLSGDD